MAYRRRKITCFISGLDYPRLPAGKMFIHHLLQQTIILTAHQLAAKPLADESRTPAGDVDVFAHQIGIDTRDEIVQVEIDILHAAIQLGGIVVAQPFRVQPLFQIAFRSNERTA